MAELDRLDKNRPNLCEALRWKGMFIWGEPDPSVQPSNSGYFWCRHTQNCLGPDGKTAEPGSCDSSERRCHRSDLPLA